MSGRRMSVHEFQGSWVMVLQFYKGSDPADSENDSKMYIFLIIYVSTI